MERKGVTERDGERRREREREMTRNTLYIISWRMTDVELYMHTHIHTYV